MNRTAGLERPLTMNHFEQATTTIACLRQFIVDCVNGIGGHVQGVPLWLTPEDGEPLRAGEWAWHGLSVPFSLDRQKGRVGIYKYAAVPEAERSALETLWLEAYLGEPDLGEPEAPIAAIRFAPATLASAELERVRRELKTAWQVARGG